MNEVINVTSDENTKNEVVLDITGGKWVSSKKLYEYLGLNLSNYAKWCKKRILENEYFSEPDDYLTIVEEPSNGAFVPKYERENTGFADENAPEASNDAFLIKEERVNTGVQPNLSQEYLLSIDFAKRLIITSKSEKGQQALESLINVEKAFAVTLEQYNELYETTRKLKNELSEVKKLVLANTPPTPLWEDDFKDKLQEYKDTRSAKILREISDDDLLDLICEKHDIDQEYYREKYIVETQDRYPNKTHYLLHFSVPRNLIFDYLNSEIQESRKRLNNPYVYFGRSWA